MVIMNTLRMLADLSFFYTFATLIASTYGGSNLFVGTLIQSVCFGLSSIGGNKRILRLLILCPMALCWYIYRTSTIDCLVLIPTGLYIIFLVFQGEYLQSHSRQSRIFSLFLKVIPFFVFLGFLSGKGAEISAITLPFAVSFLICSVFLMRSLRHQPKVYCQKKYQLANAAALALVAVGGFLLASDFFLNSCVAVLKGIYNTLILPILYLVFMGVAYLMNVFFSMLANLDWSNPAQKQDVNIEIPDVSDLLAESGVPSDFSVILKKVIIALAILLFLLFLFLFFRWLNGKEKANPGTGPVKVLSRTPLLNTSTQPQVQETSVIRSIRGQYRKFLKLCHERGIHPEPASTSLDVDTHARRLPGLSSTSGQIRNIYILARYADRGSKADLKKMKQLLAQAKEKQ